MIVTKVFEGKSDNLAIYSGNLYFTNGNDHNYLYVVLDEHTIRPYRDGETRWDLSKNLFEKALQFSNFSGKEFNNSIIGSSYVRGILEDVRIK